VKTFPIRPDPRFPFPIEVPWSLAELAYANWEPDFGARFSLDQIAKRGGWSVVEFSCHLLDAPKVIPQAELQRYVDRARDHVRFWTREEFLSKEEFNRLFHRSEYGDSVARLLESGKPLDGKALGYAILYARSLFPALCEIKRLHRLVEKLQNEKIP